MAYNLQSLVQILEQILHPNSQQLGIFDDHNKQQLEFLLKKVNSLSENLAKLAPASYKRRESLEYLIRDATYKAEDVIESRVVDQILRNPADAESSECLPLDLREVIDDFDSALDQLKNIVHQTPDTSFSGVSLVPEPICVNIEQNSSIFSVSINPNPNSQDVVFGFDEDMIQLKDLLTSQTAKLRVIPIVGMGGIGKTTLAQILYNDPLITYRFDTCAWVTISQEYNMRACLLSLLICIIGNVTMDIVAGDNDQLADIIYKSLCGKRYLIVLDDIWNSDVWDDMVRLFPENKNGSRVMLTTREYSVANHANHPWNSHHEMQLLNAAESWNLLRAKVFGKENCPRELEYMGKKIAWNCKGLPLAIQAIGGLLLEAPRKRDFWKHVAIDISSAVAKKDEQFQKILSLSYDHLPLHLRPCFLYVGCFVKDYEIRASQLIWLLVTEGFLKPTIDKTLEEVAEEYLKALVDRNLLLVRERETNGKVKSYSIHDLLRDLCKRKAEQEKFSYAYTWHSFSFPDVSVKSFENGFHGGRRVHSFSTSYLCNAMNSLSIFVRSFASFDHSTHVYFHHPRTFKLLRVLDLVRTEFKKFPKQILKLVNIRYLALKCRSGLPSAISRLWNLQVLIFRVPGYAIPPFRQHELWKLTEIRHVKFKRCYCTVEFGGKHIVLEKLQTLSYIDAQNCAESDFSEKIPNLKELGIFWGLLKDILDLSRFLKLETLRCMSDIRWPSQTILPGIIFPPSIKKLCLSTFKITWEFMSTIGSLPNLEVLKLRECTFLGEDMQLADSEWKPMEGGFLALQFLQLEELKIALWQADETHYPRLRHLVIRKCDKLKEIPRGIGDILTMELIEVDTWSNSAMGSARIIQEEQRDLGNNVLQVRVHKYVRE